MLKEFMQTTDTQQFTKNARFEKPPEEGMKAYRANTVDTSFVTVDGIEYDSNEIAMDRMARVLSTAAWRYSQALASGMEQAVAYQAVYINNTIPWKSKNNTFQLLTIEKLAEVQEASLNQLAATWVQYG